MQRLKAAAAAIQPIAVFQDAGGSALVNLVLFRVKFRRKVAGFEQKVVFQHHLAAQRELAIEPGLLQPVDGDILEIAAAADVV